MASKARLAAGCYFQTGDGAAVANTPAIVTLPPPTAASAGSSPLQSTTGFNTGVQSSGMAVIGAVNFNTTAAQLQTLLNAAPTIGTNAAGQANVLAGGGPFPTTALTLTFQNDFLSRAPGLWSYGTPTIPWVGAAGPIAPTYNTPVAGGENFSNISELTTLPFPQVKRAKKESTSFDSGVTKEFIPEFIDPGDVRIDANYNGDASQDYKAGLIYKFNQGLIYTCRVNIPNYLVGPAVVALGHVQVFKGFFTDAAIAPAKPTDILTISGTLGITGAVAYGPPL
jgi:hypothetical protein